MEWVGLRGLLVSYTHWSLLMTYGENEEMGGRRGLSRSGLGLVD
jgi:hypothetical protein